MKASDLFVQALENEQVEYIFGIPGEENLDFLQSLSRSSIKLILTRHEQAAGFMAATYGRLTGKAGVCLATLGPGATNLVTAAAYANLGAMPMVLLTGQKPVKSSKQGQFQIIDVVDLMQPLTKFTRQIESGDWVPATVREAFRLAHQERPGAAHIEFPEDVAQESTDSVPIPQSFVRRPIAERKSIAHAVDLIQQARRPLLLIGAGANRKLTCDALRAFVRKTGIYFVTSQMGKGVINEDHEQYIGNAALSSDDLVHQAIEAADLIINVGHDVVEKPPFVMQPENRQVVHVNFSPADVDPVYFPQIEVVGDIAESIAAMMRDLPEALDFDNEFFHQTKKSIAKHIERDRDDDRFPILPQFLVSQVRELMPDDGVIALDNGIYKIWFARNYPAMQPNTVLLDNALATMGAGLPSAMAAAMVFPKKKVMAICGDGGFMMNSAELETAIRLKLNLVILILRDDALGMIKWKQEHMGFGDYGLDFENPDFVRYAEAYGAEGYRIENAAQLKTKILEAYSAGGVHLIDIPMDYSLNNKILNEEIKGLEVG